LTQAATVYKNIEYQTSEYIIICSKQV
jgi:hypothetical protein